MSLLANIHIKEKIEAKYGEGCWKSMYCTDREDGLYTGGAKLKDGREVRGVFEFTGADVEEIEPLEVIAPPHKIVETVGSTEVGIEEITDQELTRYRVFTTVNSGRLQHWTGSFEERLLAEKAAQYVGIVLNVVMRGRLYRRPNKDEFYLEGSDYENLQGYAAISLLAGCVGSEATLTNTIDDRAYFTVTDPMNKLLGLLL